MKKYKFILSFLSFIITFMLYFPSISQASSLDQISSKKYLVFDRNSETVIIEKNGFIQVPMASTTKIMTCILALEHGNLKDLVKISSNAAKINGSKLKLQSNSTATLEDLLYGLMLRSGNDAAIAIAEHISGSIDNFLKLMNEKAFNLGLTNTHFTSPHGLDDDNHYTTAYELALLTNYALKNKDFKKIVSTDITSIYINKSNLPIHNTNNLLRDSYNFYGVKTGFTFKAGRCLVSAYKKNNLDIIIVTLNANTNKQRAKDTLILKNYIEDNYEVVSLENEIYTAFNNFKKEHSEIYVKSIPNSQITLEKNYDYFLIPKNSFTDYKIYIFPILSYKNFYKEKIGILEIYENKNLVKEINIILNSEIKKLDLKFYIYFMFKNLI